MKPSCAPFSGEISASTAVIIPIPKNEIDAMIRIASAAAKFASSQREVEEERDDDEEQDRPNEPVEHGEQARAAQVHRPRERRHERVLDRPLPALPGDRLGDELEDDPEVRPDDRADQQLRRRPLDVDLAAGRRERPPR